MTEVDYNGRCETPVGIAGRLRPRRSVCDEEAQLTPHGKGASWNCNQLTHSKNSNNVNENILILIHFSLLLFQNL